MPKLFKEPLVHFLLLGAGLFALNAWREGKQPAEHDVAKIEVTAAVIARLGAGYERQFGRAPDVEEVRGLVTAHIREEVLYREAMTLGLDRDDAIVRQRLAQKMEFLTDDVANVIAPDEAELRGYFAANTARYAHPARATFRHVYFSKEKRGKELEAAANQALASLSKGARDDAMGDAFLHGFEFAEQEPEDIAALFGNEFAARIGAQHVGEWQGPVSSSYGLHLVRVEARKEPQLLSFEQAREAVARDFAEERRRTMNHELFEQLRARYNVTVDEAALKQAAAIRTAEK